MVPPEIQRPAMIAPAPSCSSVVSAPRQTGLSSGPDDTLGWAAVWPTYLKLVAVRHDFVRRGTLVPEAFAALAVTCTHGLIDGMVVPLARRLRMTWPESAWLTPSWPERTPRRH